MPGFSIEVDGSTTSFEMDVVLPAGGYEITTSTGSNQYDIYALSATDQLIGYTNGLVLNATSEFSKLSILGVSSETFTFTYKGQVGIPVATGSMLAAGAYIVSIAPSSTPNIDDTFAITGGNFANNVVVKIIDQNDIEYSVKNVVRSTDTSLLVTRPDEMDVGVGPYTVKVYNPGVQQPVDSSSHLLLNSLSPGTLPVWTTSDKIYWNYGSSTTTSIQLVADDTELSDIDYSISSGTLLSGLVLDNETGVISGPINQLSVSSGDTSSIVFRATDAGGNFVEKSITLYANDGPDWITAAGQLATVDPGSSLNVTLQASSNILPGTVSYSLQSGTLHGGISLSSSGVLSGTYDGNAGSGTFVVRATDAVGLYSDLEVSIGVPFFVELSSSTSWTVPATITSIDAVVVAGGGGGGGGTNAGGGGGGAGGVIIQDSISVTPGESLSATVGAGGARGTNNGSHGNQGNSSSLSGSLFSISCTGGGYGSGVAQQSGGSGGSGGGTAGYTSGSMQPGNGISGQGNRGGLFSSYGGSGGGGKNGVGGSSKGGGGTAAGGSGINITEYVGTSKGVGGGGGGGGGYTAYSLTPGPGGYGGGSAGAYANNALPADALTGGGGGGGAYENRYGGNGGSGVIHIRYYA